MSANSSFHGTFHSNAVYMVQNIEKDEVTPGSFYKANITLTLEADNKHIGKILN